MESRENNQEIIYGRDRVMEALKAGTSINRLIYAKGEGTGSLKAILAFAKEKGILSVAQDRKKLDELCGHCNHQGVVAYIAAATYVTPEDILQVAKDKDQAPFVVILDEIQDPHNLGAILRTADAVGAHGVIIPKHRAVGLTGTVAKTSAGAVHHVPVARVTNIPATIDYLKEQGLWIAGTDLSGTMPFYQADFKGAGMASSILSFGNPAVWWTGLAGILFALGCGVITFIIRYFCAYPEGVSFSILIMNIMTPFIEKWTAKEPLGGVK